MGKVYWIVGDPRTSWHPVEKRLRRSSLSPLSQNHGGVASSFRPYMGEKKATLSAIHIEKKIRIIYTVTAIWLALITIWKW